MPSWVRDEGRWADAKKIAAKEGHADEYDYITGIYKRSGGKIGGPITSAIAKAFGKKDITKLRKEKRTDKNGVSRWVYVKHGEVAKPKDKGGERAQFEKLSKDDRDGLLDWATTANTASQAGNKKLASSLIENIGKRLREIKSSVSANTVIHLAREKTAHGTENKKKSPDTLSLPLAGKKISGLEVLDEIPNMSSIEGAVDNPKTLRGVREISFKHFFEDDSQRGSKYVSADDTAKVSDLAKQIRQSQKIKPLIVLYDSNGPSIMEGAHRFDALRELGVKSFPALIVIDEDDPPTGLDISGKVHEEDDRVKKLKQSIEFNTDMLESLNGWTDDQKKSQRWKIQKDLAEKALKQKKAELAKLGHGSDMSKADNEWPEGEKTIFRGLPISIETARGDYRFWQDGQGDAGLTPMEHDYGFIAGTLGADGEEIDCFLGPSRDSDCVVVVHQMNPATGRWDEDKCMLGFDSPENAIQAYRNHYTDADERIGAATVYDFPAFQRAIKARGETGKALAFAKAGAGASDATERDQFLAALLSAAMTAEIDLVPDGGDGLTMESTPGATVYTGSRRTLLPFAVVGGGRWGTHGDPIAALAAFLRTVAVPESEARDYSDDDQIVDIFLKAAAGAERSGHAYTSRKMGPDGQWIYDYGDSEKEHGETGGSKTPPKKYADAADKEFDDKWAAAAAKTLREHGRPKPGDEKHRDANIVDRWNNLMTAGVTPAARKYFMDALTQEVTHHPVLLDRIAKQAGIDIKNKGVKDVYEAILRRATRTIQKAMESGDTSLLDRYESYRAKADVEANAADDIHKAGRDNMGAVRALTMDAEGKAILRGAMPGGREYTATVDPGGSLSAENVGPGVETLLIRKAGKDVFRWRNGGMDAGSIADARDAKRLAKGLYREAFSGIHKAGPESLDSLFKAIQADARYGLHKAFGKKDISKLTKKVVTDKNGKKRTVYIRTGTDKKKHREHIDTMRAKKKIKNSPKVAAAKQKIWEARKGYAKKSLAGFADTFVDTLSGEGVDQGVSEFGEGALRGTAREADAAHGAHRGAKKEIHAAIKDKRAQASKPKPAASK